MLYGSVNSETRQSLRDDSPDSSGSELMPGDMSRYAYARGLAESKKTRTAQAAGVSPSFVDVFAGCGGLSLGLLNAGWVGRMAIEKNQDAFNTLSVNLLGGQRRFEWPTGLPQRPYATATLLRHHREELLKMKGRVELLAGGPPCQGFSLAGRRIHGDPRNALFRQYLAIVKHVAPRLVFIENVQGFDLPFKPEGNAPAKTYSDVLRKKLDGLGYVVFSEVVDFSKFGVPQRRRRFILIAIRKGDLALARLGDKSPFELLRSSRTRFLRAKGLPTAKAISSRQAIGDLETVGKTLIACAEPNSSGFQQIDFARAVTCLVSSDQ